jgi:ferredoxin
MTGNDDIMILGGYMADKKERWEDNEPGAWYVDKMCILCSVCENVAPDTFRIADDGDHDIVHKQPETEDELLAAQDALDQCPVDAIGKDGDED